MLNQSELFVGLVYNTEMEDNLMISCIYTIINQTNSKCYIGSSKNFKKRIATHWRELKNGNHHSIYLQRAYNKYGKDSFQFSILEECDEHDLLQKEEEWIELLNPEYNVGGVGGDNYTNNPNKDQIKKKLIAILKNVKRPSLPGKKNPNWKGGRVKKNTTCKCGNWKSYTAKTCIDCSDRAGRNNSFHGKKHSKESIQKMRDKQLGKKPVNSQRCIIDGVEYDSLSDAAKEHGCTTATVANRIRNPKFNTWHFDNA